MRGGCAGRDEFVVGRSKHRFVDFRVKAEGSPVYIGRSQPVGVRHDLLGSPPGLGHVDVGGPPDSRVRARAVLVDVRVGRPSRCSRLQCGKVEPSVVKSRSPSRKTFETWSSSGTRLTPCHRMAPRAAVVTTTALAAIFAVFFCVTALRCWRGTPWDLDRPGVLRAATRRDGAPKKIKNSEKTGFAA